MRPYAITKPNETFCGHKKGEEVFGYKDKNKYYYWWKSKKTAIKYAKSFSEYRHIYKANLTEYNEAVINRILLNEY